MPLDILSLVSEPGFAPRAWQTGAPRDSYGGNYPVGDSSELRRILSLPRRAVEDGDSERGEALVELISARYRRPPGPCHCGRLDPPRECITDLRFAQAWALREIAIVGGLLGDIGVGHGKTILDILALLALEPHGVRLGLLLVPPRLVGQLVDDYVQIAQHFRVPSLLVHAGDSYRHVVDGAPVLHVLPYSRLCQPAATSWIRNLRPQAIIADEVHRLRDPNTATVKRVLRHFDEFPETRFCGWTGTLTSGSIRDYAHLSALALKHHSPLPRDLEVIEDWSRALDPRDNPCDPGPLMELCAPGEHVTSGFRRRVNETCGVVTTAEASVDVELSIRERVPDGVDASDESTLPDAIRSALAMVRDGERPDGDPIVDSLMQAKCAREVACGFYYRWIFPNGESRELVEEWLEVRKCWRKELRRKVLDGAEHLDSPALCQYAAERYHGDRPKHKDLPAWDSVYWPAWRDIRDRVQPETEPVRIDDFLARDAAAWALESRGVVWYDRVEFGLWVAELSGLPLYGGGESAWRVLRRETGSRSVIVSMPAHGTGFNGLQFAFADQLIANPPSSPTAWEQGIGRLLRPGQRARRVSAWYYAHTREVRQHVESAVRAAEYVEQTRGTIQKLVRGRE